ncbi:MAG: MFS transporter [Chloroflexi bacterium]|nr:MFS transporter [Chloroflexota bacterium]
MEKATHLAKPAKRGFYYGYVVVAAGFFTWLMMWGMSQSFGVFFKVLIAEFGWTRADTVLAYSLIAITQAFLVVLMGWLTDKLGPRFVITIFGSFVGVAYFLLSQITALWQFHASYVLAAVGLSTASTPVMVTVARWFIKKRSMMMGIVQSGAGIGGFIIAPLTGWLISGYGWRSAYATLGAIVLAGIIICGLLMRRDPGSTRLPEDEAAAPAPHRHTGGKGPAPSGGISLRQRLRTRHFWIIVGIFFSFGFCRSTFLPHIAVYVQDAGYSLADGANVVAVLTVSSILGRLSMGRLGNKAAFKVAFFLTACALTFGMLTQDLWGFYLFAFAFGVGWGAQAVLRNVVASDTFGLASLGLFLGVLGFAEAMASAFGSYFAGLAFDLVGSYQPAFIAGILISINGVVLTSILTRRPAPAL